MSGTKGPKGHTRHPVFGVGTAGDERRPCPFVVAKDTATPFRQRVVGQRVIGDDFLERVRELEVAGVVHRQIVPTHRTTPHRTMPYQFQH